MIWTALIKNIKGKGYAGKDDDLAAVKAFLTDKNIAPKHKGAAVDIDKAYAEQYPPADDLDLTGDTAQAEFEAKVTAEVEKRQKLEDEISGKAKARMAGAGTATDIKVGKERFEDDPNGGFPTFGHFLAEVIKSPTQVMNDSAIVRPPADSRLGKWNKSYNQRMKAELHEQHKAGVIGEEIYKATLSTFSNETTGADGGVAVPPEFRTGIMNRIEAPESIAAKCERATLSGNSMALNIDDTTPWQTSTGILTYWIGETTAITQSKLSLKQRDFRLRKLCALVPMTEELAQDAAFLGGYTTKKAGDKLGFAVDKAILFGDGVTQPTGVVGHAGTVSVTKETSQAATTIKARNVMKMWMACEPSVRARSFWIINPDCQFMLQTMALTGLKDSTATPQAWGSHVYMPMNGLVGQPNDTLMGRPIIYHQAAQTLGTVGDITLFCPSEYLLLTKASGIQTDSSIHLWFDQAVNALRFLYRVEGQPLWPGTVAALNGSQTYGAFVTTATRS